MSRRAGSEPVPPLRPASVAVHAGFEPDLETGALVPGLLAVSTYRHGNRRGFGYSREGHPGWQPLEEALAALEGGAGARLFASGMAAIEAVVEQVPSGALVVAPQSSYSGTRRLLGRLEARGRLRHRLVDATDTAAVEAAVGGAALLCLETITNPLLGIADLRACAAAAHAAGARVLVDNTFATPLAVRPLDLGADLVVHSLTKYVGGHSDLVLGVAVAAAAASLEALDAERTAAGAIPGTLETWLALRGLRTLDVRVRRQFASAAELADRLRSHAAVEQVIHPALPDHPQHRRALAELAPGLHGGILCVVARGGAAAAERVCASTRLWTHATSLGSVESTLERRARYPLDAAVCPPGLIRCSTGIEHVDDLFADLEQALDGAS